MKNKIKFGILVMIMAMSVVTATSQNVLLEGKFLHRSFAKVTVEEYDLDGTLLVTETKSHVNSYFRELKSDRKYVITFKSKDVTKVLECETSKKARIIIDVDFSSKNNCKIQYSKDYETYITSIK